MAHSWVKFGCLPSGHAPVRDFELIVNSNGVILREIMTVEEQKMLQALLQRMAKNNEITERGVVKIEYREDGSLEVNTGPEDFK